jgi:lysophospholipase
VISACLSGQVNQARAEPNPHGLITESRLPTIYGEEIAPFWETGIEGKFKSEVKNRKDAFEDQENSRQDIELSYMAFGSGAEEIAIVLSTGRTESYIKYKELVYDLHRQGFAVYILDHRGQGFSGRIDSNPERKQMGDVLRFDDYVTDLNTFARLVRDLPNRQHRRYVLVGHSMGGAIASLYLEAYPNDFERAVLSSPMHEPKTGMVSNEMACRALDIKEWFGRGKNYAPGKGAYDDKSKLAQDDCCTHSPVRYEIMRKAYDLAPKSKIGGPTVRWVAEACAASKRVREDAGKVAVPVLLLQATADPVVTPEGQEEFCENLNNKRTGACKLEKIEGAYHELFIESDTYRIPAVTKMIDFIKAR